ncbi:MAG TPA: sigma-70 family RNA polymerase sigma factor [Longimicrobiales bacterium]|nr:sigma-70 family RNA polymerase sigma factor [Longimicrobiales bacterium]
MKTIPAGDQTSVLVERARAGDSTAFEGLYRQHAGRVYALCLRMAGEATRAEELTQDVFVRVWQKLELFRGDSAFTTWLHRLAVNVVLQTLRGEKRREKRVHFTDDLDPFDHSGGRATPGKRIDLERALGTLPEGARAVFLLHDVEGYKHSEIAEMTGSAVGTSKAQLHRARKLLREALER